MTDRSAYSVEAAIRALYSRMLKKVFKKTDRGKEFSCYVVWEKDTNNDS